MDNTQQLDSSFFADDKEQNVDKPKETESNPDLYRVSLDLQSVKNRTYEARGRFLKDPTWKEDNGTGYKRKLAKNMYYLPDPAAPDRKMYVECPSNWNVPRSNNILTQAFFYLYKHESATLRSIARNFTQLQYWWSLYQIMLDEQQPELVGKIKIIRYGNQVNEKIEEASKDQPNIGKIGVDVFSFYEGKDFHLHIGEKTIDDKARPGQTKKITSYEKSEFFPEICSMMIDGKRIPQGSNQLIMSLYKDAPSLHSMATVKWDDAMEQKVIESMRIVIQDDSILNDILDIARKGARRQRVTVSPESKEKLASETASSQASSQPSGAAAGTQQQATHQSQTQPQQQQSSTAAPVQNQAQSQQAQQSEQAMVDNDEADFSLPNVENEEFSGLD